MKSSLEIAQEHDLRPVEEIASELGLVSDEFELYGRYKAKVSLDVLQRLRGTPNGKIICVTGMTPTIAGEGQTTTAVSLTQGLGRIDARAMLCLREPSLGPVFGSKGGAAGGGFAQVVPMEDLNLHFTGDIHAVGAANNLLAAMIDASILYGNPLKIDALQIGWRRVVDVNDRALRHIALGLGGRANGYPLESGFDITGASEVMAVLAQARDLHDLRQRLGRITIGYSYDGSEPVTADDLRAAGAMTVLLKDAIKPNLIQTLEGQACLMHTGPFSDIAHGNNSLLADLIAGKLADYVVTQPGFGSDMGMEKFMNIVCRQGAITPSAVVLVASVRALKHHGDASDAHHTNGIAGMRAIEDGAANLRRHQAIIASFGLPCVVAVNRRPGDTDEEIELVRRLAMDSGAFAAEVDDGYARGGEGAVALARAAVAATKQAADLRYTYPDKASIKEKIESIAQGLYGAGQVIYYPAAEARVAQFTADGLDILPVCMAKTALSLSADPHLLGAPDGFQLPVRDLRAYTGAGWVVALCGDVQQMPGMRKVAAAMNVDIDPDGRTLGLF